MAGARLVRTTGWIVAVGSLFGAACAVAIIAWHPEVPASRLSYPFGPTSFVGSQVAFAVQHLTLAAGFVGLITLFWREASAVLRAGLMLALAGTAMLAVWELVALAAIDARNDSAIATIVSSGYGVPTVLIGLGLVLAGIPLARRRRLPGTLGRWIVLASGVYVFVPLLPALAGPMVVGRVGLGVWFLLLAGIGLVLVRVTR